MMLGHEKAWAAVALRYAKHLDDACPDVGMGPSARSLLEDITPDGVKLSHDDETDIIELAGLT